MNRWITPLALTLTLVFSSPAFSQLMQREVPRDVLPGRLVVTQPPEAMLDGRPARLSPGARIRGTNNLLALSGSLVGQDLPVVYKRDPLGLVHEAWILTEDEYTRLSALEPSQGNPQALQAFLDLLALVFLRRP